MKIPGFTCKSIDTVISQSEKKNELPYTILTEGRLTKEELDKRYINNPHYLGVVKFNWHE